MNKSSIFTLAALVSALSLTAGSRGDITLLGTDVIPGDSRDKSGLTNPITDKLPHNLAGSFGSGLDYPGKDDLYLAVNDRGPGDGALPFRCRFQTLRITLKPGSDKPVTASIEATTFLNTETGQPLTGLASAIYPGDPNKSARFDAEGVRLSGHNSIFVSDEYGPWIDEFSLDGTRLRRLQIPEKFKVAHPSADPAEEVVQNTSGREPNHGFEGLAISPDRSTLWAIVQAPLIQDGQPKDAQRPEGSRRGTYCRILEISLATGVQRELAYPLSAPSHKVCELLTVDDHRLLVLERDGSAAKVRGLHLIDLAGASDVSKLERLPVTGELPDGVKPVLKRAWLDFMDPRFNLTGQMPEKIEGLAFGPRLGDGRRTLVVTSDNDLKLEEPTRIWIFTCEDQDLGLEAGMPPARKTTTSR